MSCWDVRAGGVVPCAARPSSPIHITYLLQFSGHVRANLVTHSACPPWRAVTWLLRFSHPPLSCPMPHSLVSYYSLSRYRYRFPFWNGPQRPLPVHFLAQTSRSQCFHRVYAFVL